MEKSENKPNAVSSALPAAARGENSRSRNSPGPFARAAMVCGIPVPSVHGKTWSRSHKMSSNPSGMSRKTAHGAFDHSQTEKVVAPRSA
jgi:hypothetical protein